MINNACAISRGVTAMLKINIQLSELEQNYA